MSDLALARAAPGPARVERAIRGAVVREQSLLALLAMPALVVMALLLLAPMAWLLALSFLDGQEALSARNYLALFADASYSRSFLLTVRLGVIVTVICAVAGYVLAYAMMAMPGWMRTLCLALVALPFWTSVLVRTYAWLVLLQNQGVVNKLLIKLGILSAPLAMMHNLTGTLIGMVHIMLPFVVFPLYAAMQRIDPDLSRAALGLGASPGYTFWRIFLPLSLPGLMAGVVLVFVLSLGFYVTPALLGGGSTMVMSLVIEREINMHMAWGPAGAVAALFVVTVLAIFALVGRFMSLERIFQGR